MPELTDFEHSYDDEIIPVSYADPGLIEKKNWYAMRAFEYSGSLMKVGRSSKKWITRWYVLKNYTMLIYNSKSSSEPKRKQTLSKINSILFRYHFPQRSLLRKMQRERWPFRHSLVLRGKFQILAKMDVPQGCGLG